VLTSTTGPTVGGAVVGGAVDGGGLGVDGGGDVGAAPHGTPLIVQFSGSPRLAALKPKLTEPPGAIVPFHPASVNRCWLPTLVRTALHDRVTVVPACRSNSTVQPVAAASPEFRITTSAPYPEFQADVCTTAALSTGPAACAVGARAITPPARTTPMPPITSLRRPAIQ
jgi:hypothetical protein